WQRHCALSTRCPCRTFPISRMTGPRSAPPWLTGSIATSAPSSRTTRPGGVLQDDASWAGLPVADRPHLTRVRAHYAAYAGRLSALATQIPTAEAALTHGDLAFDNVMLKQNGDVALIDWGEARITSGLADVASTITYADWPFDDVQRFLALTFEGDQAALDWALPVIERLIRLTRYRSCVQSLCWLNEEGPDGLDAVGRAHFERQLGAL
ncbi:MAG: phosphotransferase, partial [Anaerolineae bacterium]|nr:phosphotransferase [Anaerolineae bacterium]